MTLGLVHPSVITLHDTSLMYIAVAVQPFQPILVYLWLQKDKVRETRTTFLRKHPLPAKEESFWHLPHLEKVWST